MQYMLIQHIAIFTHTRMLLMNEASNLGLLSYAGTLLSHICFYNHLHHTASATKCYADFHAIDGEKESTTHHRFHKTYVACIWSYPFICSLVFLAYMISPNDKSLSHLAIRLIAGERVEGNVILLEHIDQFSSTKYTLDKYKTRRTNMYMYKAQWHEWKVLELILNI